jgi:regulator of cell morphogenesis and NO signaling
MDSFHAADQTERAGRSGRNWQAAPLSDLIAPIKSTHHKFVRGEIERLGPPFDKVCSAHEKNHPELEDMRAAFGGLAQELAMHMMKEEMVLFPYIVRLEEAAVAKESVLPSPFGSVRNPVAMMMRGHDATGNALRGLRQASNGYAAPADACIGFQTQYQGLQEFEADLHQHIHLENNILFPRAVEMERSH